MGQQGRALLFLLPSEREYVDKLQGHGVQVQQGNLMQHISHLHNPADRAPAQVSASLVHHVELSMMRVDFRCQTEDCKPELCVVWHWVAQYLVQLH